MLAETEVSKHEDCPPCPTKSSYRRDPRHTRARQPHPPPRGGGRVRPARHGNTARQRRKPSSAPSDRQDRALGAGSRQRGGRAPGRRSQQRDQGHHCRHRRLTGHSLNGRGSSFPGRLRRGKRRALVTSGGNDHAKVARATASNRPRRLPSSSPSCDRASGRPSRPRTDARMASFAKSTSSPTVAACGNYGWLRGAREAAKVNACRLIIRTASDGNGGLAQDLEALFRSTRSFARRAVLPFRGP